MMLSFNASSVPILQLALSSNDARPRSTLFDYAARTSSARNWRPVAGAAIPLPYGGKVRQVQIDLDQQALHAHGLSANDVDQRARDAEPDHPGRDREDRHVRIHRRSERLARAIAAFNDLPIKTVNGTVVYMRDVAYRA